VRALVPKENLALVAVVALVAYLALVPAGFLLSEAFVPDGRLTLDEFRDAYSTVGLASMVGNSLWFAAGSSVLALVTGSSLAFLVVRTDVPLRRLAFVGALVPLIVPGILYTIAWIYLASPRSGALAEVLPVDPEIFGMGGMIFVEGLHLSPLVFLLMAAALRSSDPALEEAALMSGASRRTVLRRITLPLARPALYAALLIMVVRALEAFEVPALLGIPSGTWVFTSRIWEALDGFPADLGAAAAYAVSLLALTLVGVFVYSRMSRSGARYQTVSGRGQHPRRIELGSWRRPVTVAMVAYLAVASLLPLLMLLYVSTQRFYAAPSIDGLSRATFENYRYLVENDATIEAFTNSLLLGVGTATAVTLVMAAAAWLVVRSRLPGRSILDALASLPLAIPGLVLGVALLFVYLRSPLPVYGTLWILFIAYFTRFMPYGMRYAAAAMHQLSGELEEAARMSGASFAQTFRRVTLPLLLPALAAGWLYVLIVAMRELSTSILLYSPGSEVLPVRIFTLYEGGQFTKLAALGVVMVLAMTALAAIAYRLGARVGAWAE
jgi:iron(III) transport system permease protein